LSYTQCEQKLDNGHIMKYKIVKMEDYDNTELYYPGDLPDHLIQHLEYFRKNGTRLRFYYGDIQTGRDYNEYYDIRGHLGFTTGDMKIPILVHNSRSYGGPALFSHIVKAEVSKTKEVFYIHPKYYLPKKDQLDNKKYEIMRLKRKIKTLNQKIRRLRQ